MQSWIHVIEWRATVHPDLPALVDDRGTTLTYAELRTATGKALKRELREQGARQ